MVVKKIKTVALAAAACLALSLSMSAPLFAQSPEAGADLKGLWLTTDYPEFTLRLAKSTRIELALRNYNLPPQRVELKVTGIPESWTWSLKGGNRAVTAAMVAPDATETVELELEAPDDAKPGTYQIAVEAASEAGNTKLPLTVTLAKAMPAELKLEPELPALRGSPRSTFDFRVKITNEGPQDTLVSLAAQTPPGFSAVFKQAYGSKELTGIPVKAGATESVSVEVKPAETAPAGQYPIVVAAKSEQASATTRLIADVTGQPQLGLEGPQGRLSGQANAGEEATFTFALTNSGSAPAQDVELSASQPSGWKVEFEPKQIAALPPSERQEVQVRIMPSHQAIAGDYVVPVRANGDGASDNADFRVTVTTSTLWGMVGLGIIAAAVAVLGVAVARYGRR